MRKIRALQWQLIDIPPRLWSSSSSVRISPNAEIKIKKHKYCDIKKMTWKLSTECKLWEWMTKINFISFNSIYETIQCTACLTTCRCGLWWNWLINFFHWKTFLDAIFYKNNNKIHKSTNYVLINFFALEK